MASLALDVASHYVYEPLEPGQIRILQLAPGNKSETLIGELLIMDFDEKFIEYDALSYMWGDPASTDTIYLSGSALPIASNLATALYHLRYIKSPLTIWVDAVCINQGDIIERSEQVRLMRQLYKRAKSVRIWINEPKTDGTSEAVTALRNFCKIARNREEGLKSLGDEPSFWDPVVPIFANEYWSRAWIQQEVLNATQISLHCMDIVIPGMSIAYFQKATSDKLNNIGASLEESDQVLGNHLTPILAHFSPAARDLLDYQYGERFWYLCDLMSTDLEMTKPQDRLYALMHLASDYDDGGITVDYSKSGIGTAVDAARYHVQVHCDLRFLTKAYLEACGDTNDYQEETRDIPTWLPYSWCGGHSIDAVHPADYSAARKTKCIPESISTAEQLLRVRGVRLDSVKSCFNHVPDIWHVTIRQFWTSSIGLYLQDLADTNTKEIPLEVLKVLIGFYDGSLGDFRELREYEFANAKVEASSNHPHNQDNDSDENMRRLMYEAARSGLSVLSGLAQDPRSADQYLYHGEAMPNADLLSNVDLDARVGLHLILDRLEDHIFVLTANKKLGRALDCAIEVGDEIWMVLGCNIPVIVRPRPNGRYWHVCVAEFPVIEEHADLNSMSTNVQPGDIIGNWVVEDIQIE